MAERRRRIARKKSLYTTIQADEAAALERTQDEGLSQEIAMLRILLRRLFELAEIRHSASQSCPEGGDTRPADAANLSMWLKITSAAGIGFTRLARLMRAHKQLSNGAEDAAAALSEALREVNR